MAVVRLEIRMRYFTLLPAKPLRDSPFCCAMYDGCLPSAQRGLQVSPNKQ
jgi:hypothetical protein